MTTSTDKPTYTSNKFKFYRVLIQYTENLNAPRDPWSYNSTIPGRAPVAKTVIAQSIANAVQIAQSTITTNQNIVAIEEQPVAHESLEFDEFSRLINETPESEHFTLLLNILNGNLEFLPGDIDWSLDQIIYELQNIELLPRDIYVDISHVLEVTMCQAQMRRDLVTHITIDDLVARSVGENAQLIFQLTKNLRTLINNIS